jgi:hypothetical protein
MHRSGHARGHFVIWLTPGWAKWVPEVAPRPWLFQHPVTDANPLTLKDIVLSSLERELDAPLSGAAPPVARWGQRKFLPEFARLEAAGAFTARPGDRDITVLISDDRDGR